MALRVLVVGGGVGGLCLAQGLRKAGIGVRVFERACAAEAAGPAYRLRIDAHGIRALARCLPEELFGLFRASASEPYMPGGAAFDHQLNVVFTWRSAPEPLDPRRASSVTNRRTLCQLLAAGLGDAVEWGRSVVAVEETADGVRAHLAGGRTVPGDVLVAADGADSTLRGRLLPQAELVDTGLRGIHGQAPLDEELLAGLPPVLLGGSAPIVGPAGTTFAVGSYRPCRPPERAAAELAPYARLDPVPGHVRWTLVAPPESLGLTEEDVWSTPPARLHDTARRLTADWHPALAALVAGSDPGATFPFAMRAALPVPAWPTGRVTLLGDAIHATTAVGGNGASVALRDAAELTERLAGVGPDGTGLPAALAGYEESMRGYGFDAAMDSLRSAEQIFRVFVPALS
jgi:2-polyprenyl-6-methoxyphenol hydroxylase-like FAD-dependent oxidoreductase